MIKIFILLFFIHFVNSAHFFRGTFFDEQTDLPKEISEKYYHQKLDHFDYTSTVMWNQRYLVNDGFYKKGGPVFINIGGEGEAGLKWLSSGNWINLAKEFNALCFSLEHRYYGKSHPTQNMSTENLRWLNSEQALADIASFRVNMSILYELRPETKFVSFGGSYSGALSAWFRLKYPHLVDIAVSSSAPLLAQMNFEDYFGVVRDSLATTGPTCVSTIANATEQLTRLVRAKKNLPDIKKMFSMCDDLDPEVELDVQNFFSTLSGNFAGVVQYNRDNRPDAPGSNVTITTICDVMTNKKIPSVLQRLANVNSLILKAYGQSCLDFKYSKLVDSIKNVAWQSTAGAGMRQWTYQTCTEFGYFQTSDLDDQPFGNLFPLSFSLAQCRDIFGPFFTKYLLEQGISDTNQRFGAKNITTSKTVFINGSIDPWHKLSLISGPVGANVVIYIQGTAHCANMYPDSSSDLPQLREARRAIRNSLYAWL